MLEREIQPIPLADRDQGEGGQGNTAGKRHENTQVGIRKANDENGEVVGRQEKQKDQGVIPTIP